MRTLITSVSRPTTTSTVSPPPIETEEEDDNPAIIDLNETTSASTSNILASVTARSNRNQISSNYIPSFHQTTRPSRRHLFSRVLTRTRNNRQNRPMPNTGTRTITQSCNYSSSLDETIINIETLEIADDNDFCAVIDTTQSFQTEEGISLAEVSDYPSSTTTVTSNTPPSPCATPQERSNCLMATNTRVKENTASQMSACGCWQLRIA